MIQYWLLLVAVVMCPSAILYIAVVMISTLAFSRWLRRELENKLDRNRLVTEGASDEKTVCESLDECERVCVGWSPFLPIMPLLLLGAAIYVSRLKM